VLQQQQSAVRVHHHRLAGLAKFASVVPAPLRLHGHFVEHTPAAAWRGKCSVAHDTAMFRRSHRAGQLTQSTGVAASETNRTSHFATLSFRRKQRKTLFAITPASRDESLFDQNEEHGRSALIFDCLFRLSTVDCQPLISTPLSQSEQSNPSAPPYSPRRS
jgi:hypothetical protein